MPKNNSKFKISNLKLRSAFTLIELLVVIAIIGILTTLISFAFQDSQQKSRDSRRKTDLDAIKKALELAKQDTAGAFSYPRCYTGAATCVLTEPDPINHPADDRETNPPLSPIYIKMIPYDPKTNTGYIYYTYASDGTTACTSSCPKFKLVACLENTKDPQGDTVNDAVSCPTSGTKSYTITNS